MSLSKDEQEIFEEIGRKVTVARDYSGFVEWGVSNIPNWTKQWSDYTITDPGILILNADAFLYDQLNFRIDNMYIDNILRFSRSREQLFYMAELVGLYRS